MRESIAPKSVDLSKLERKKHLKKLSNDKVMNWPNTLEALRIKKESFTKDREAAAEAARQEVDRQVCMNVGHSQAPLDALSLGHLLTDEYSQQEAEIRRKARLDAIRKANDLIYNQTDKMKMLNGQILYADVIATRVQQIASKQLVKEQEKIKDAEYHQHILKEVARLEVIEKEKVDRTRSILANIKVARVEQLDEVRRKREEILQKDIDEGTKMKLDAQKRLEEELAQYEEKRKYVTESNLKMLKANSDLKTIKDQLRQRELEAEAARDAQVEGIEFKKLEVKRLEKERFEKSQSSRQQLIDSAVKQLTLQSSKEGAILSKQMTEQRDKEDRHIADKAAKLEEDWAITVASRTEQIRAKREKIEKQKEYDDMLVAKWKRENEEGIQQEMEKIINARKATVANKAIARAEADAKAAKATEDRIRDMEQTRFLQSIDTNDEGRFVEICQAEIARNIKLGKPVYTLLRALEYRPPNLLPAK